ncbi:MAG: hypothetical protein R2838_18890 [Caldilineaceae bacterium]
MLDGRTIAFIGLERIGGVMIYDVTDPRAPQFIDYVNRDFTVASEEAGDSAPEGLKFIPADESPTAPLLIVASNSAARPRSSAWTSPQNRSHTR